MSHSNSLRKEARIPSPWRLQLPMPSPCTFFLRMDIFRDTFVREILYFEVDNFCFPYLRYRDAAAAKCESSSHCFFLEADGARVEEESTVENSGLFNKKLEILISSDC